MGNLGAVSQGDCAIASVVLSAGTPSMGANRGFSSTITDNGVGDFSLTLDQAQAVQTAGCVIVQPQGTTAIIPVVEIVSATVLRIRLFTDAGAAVDASFWIRVTPISPA